MCLFLQTFVPVPLQFCTGRLCCDCLLLAITRNTGMPLLIRILLVCFTAPPLCSVVTPGTILVDQKAPRALTAAGSRLSPIRPPCVPPRSIRPRRDYGGPRDPCRDRPTRTAYIHHCSVSGRRPVLPVASHAIDSCKGTITVSRMCWLSVPSSDVTFLVSRVDVFITWFYVHVKS